MKLACRTRGNTDPRGKSQVCFTAHPKDYELYLDLICSELLERQNCAVYYETEDPSIFDENELHAVLDQMKLIVIPVTSRFLHEESRARLVELPYALKNHIPVLPLIEEEGLYDDFNSICGDLQTLSRFQKGDALLPYGEKLTRYLENVLIGDELAEKVRAAFDAYVFLSYRKKDRASAQGLRELIHKNPMCRDIAVWYDEFLVPGEAFNNAIEDAMKKCSLFALAVTPSILEDGNYVMTTEYPNALKMKKRVLPALLEKTDLKELNEKYPGITDPVSPEAVSEILRKLALRKNDDPMHTFFIGLAYLGGIDVVTDHKLALELISSAADAGIPEAAQKLVSMYRNAQGVNRDYNEALRWQKKLADLRRKDYEKQADLETETAFAAALWDLGDQLNELHRSEEARAAYEEMNHAAEEVSDYRHMTVSLIRLGTLCQAAGDISQARSYFESGLGKLNEFPETANADVFDVGSLFERMVDLCILEQDYPAAETYIENLQKLAGKTKDDIYAKNAVLSSAYERLGDIAVAQKRFKDARPYFDKLLVFRKDQFAENETYQSRRNLSVALNKVIENNLRLGVFDHVDEYENLSEQLAEKNVAEAGTHEAITDLSYTVMGRAAIAFNRNDLDTARRYYEKAAEIRTQMAGENGTAEEKAALAFTYLMLGEVCMKQRSHEDAKMYHGKNLKLREELCVISNSQENRSQLALANERMGILCQAEGNVPETLKFYSKMIELRQALAMELSTVQNVESLAVSYTLLSTADRNRVDRASAQMAYQLWSQLSNLYPGNYRYARERDNAARMLNAAVFW